MRNLILTILVLFLTSGMAFAQQDQEVQEKAKMSVTAFTELLALTKEQQTTVYNIFFTYGKADHIIWSNSKLSNEEKKKQIADLQAQTENKLIKALTDKQKAKYAAEKKNTGH